MQNRLYEGDSRIHWSYWQITPTEPSQQPSAERMVPSEYISKERWQLTTGKIAWHAGDTAKAIVNAEGSGGTASNLISAG
jgi:hypothetical protein